MCEVDDFGNITCMLPCPERTDIPCYLVSGGGHKGVAPNIIVPFPTSPSFTTREDYTDYVRFARRCASADGKFPLVWQDTDGAIVPGSSARWTPWDVPGDYQIQLLAPSAQKVGMAVVDPSITLEEMSERFDAFVSCLQAYEPSQPIDRKCLH